MARWVGVGLEPPAGRPPALTYRWVGLVGRSGNQTHSMETEHAETPSPGKQYRYRHASRYHSLGCFDREDLGSTCCLLLERLTLVVLSDSVN